MNAKSIAHAVAQLIFVLAIPLLLMIGAARLTLSHQFLRFEYSRTGFPADAYGLLASDRMALGDYAIDYLFNGEDIAFLADLRLPIDKCWQPPRDARDCPMFTATELRHMSDVKQMARLVFSLALTVLLAAIAIVVVAYRDRSYFRFVIRGINIGCILTLALLATTVVLVSIAWDQAFDAFHELFFAAGTWRFLYSDSLIRLYPERLFVDASVLIGVLMAVGALLLLLINSRATEANI